jgi:hypothetical protein
VKFERDPKDRRYPERLAGSFLASLIFHALLALLVFSVLVSSSEEGATESVQGGEVVTVERTSPLAVTNQPATAHAVPPAPHVRVVAPLQHAPLAQPEAQRQPVNRHELAVVAPTAPPNPRPVPQQTPQPNPQPTENIFETQPSNAIPAAPVSIPTVGPVSVAIKPPPTTQPSPAPTSAPSARPTQRPPEPVARATARPTPAPVLPKASPTAAAVARATAAPSASPAPAVRASAPPAERSGVPNPSPTSTAAVARTPGAAPSPGPSGGPSPGPHAGNAPKGPPAPARPVAIRPTPPAPRVTPAPKSQHASDINAKLRSMIPNNPVHPTTKQYTMNYSLRGKIEPTPPPDVLAATKYMYEVQGTGNESRVKMWVTGARKAGPTTICTGWLVRYPEAIRGGYADPGGPANVQNQQHSAPANGTQIAIGGNGPARPPLSPFDAGIAPIVDGIVSQPCDGRRLVPFVPSPAPSP